MVITEAALADKTGYIKAVWFNQPYLQRSLTDKRRVVVAGKVGEISRNGLELRSPEHEFAESPEKGLHVGRLVPVYPLTAKLSAKWMRRWVRSALDMALHAVEGCGANAHTGAQQSDGGARSTHIRCIFPPVKEQHQKRSPSPCIRRVFLHPARHATASQGVAARSARHSG